jgi:hypothetical protein
VIDMAVRHEEDLHLRRIEAEFLKSGEQLRVELRGGTSSVARAKRVDHQQALRRPNHIDRGPTVADREDLVEDPARGNRRIVGPVGARLLAPKVDRVRPARSHVLFSRSIMRVTSGVSGLFAGAC